MKINALLKKYLEHTDYLVAYNTTRVLGFPTEEVVMKFNNQPSTDNIAPTHAILPESKTSWWMKLFGTK